MSKTYPTGNTIVTLHTDGCGYWSVKAKPVGVEKFELAYIGDDEEFGELRVFFKTRDWNVYSDGYIYTDDKFLRLLQEFLVTIGLDGSDVSYSEHGMQGEKYVSFDTGPKFISSYRTKFPVVYTSLYRQMYRAHA